jgi:hypothetical protein
VTYGGDSGNRIFVLYWRCPLIRGSTVFGLFEICWKTISNWQIEVPVKDLGLYILQYLTLYWIYAAIMMIIIIRLCRNVGQRGGACFLCLPYKALACVEISILVCTCRCWCQICVALILLWLVNCL